LIADSTSFCEAKQYPPFFRTNNLLVLKQIVFLNGISLSNQALLNFQGSFICRKIVFWLVATLIPIMFNKRPHRSHSLALWALSCTPWFYIAFRYIAATAMLCLYYRHHDISANLDKADWYFKTYELFWPLHHINAHSTLSIGILINPLCVHCNCQDAPLHVTEMFRCSKFR